MSINQPADLDTFNLRRALIAKRNAESDQVRRAQISVLIEMMGSYDRAVSELHRAALADNIKRQMALL